MPGNIKVKLCNVIDSFHARRKFWGSKMETSVTRLFHRHLNTWQKLKILNFKMTKMLYILFEEVWHGNRWPTRNVSQSRWTSSPKVSPTWTTVWYHQWWELKEVVSFDPSNSGVLEAPCNWAIENPASFWFAEGVPCIVLWWTNLMWWFPLQGPEVCMKNRCSLQFPKTGKQRL